MNLKINGKDQILDFDTMSIRQMLTVCDVSQPDMVSVQLNGAFVNKENYDSMEIKDGDEVDFLYFMGGGVNQKVLHVKKRKKGSGQAKIYNENPT